MEEYRRRLKRRNVFLWMGIVLLAALDVVVGIFWDSLGFLDVRQMTRQARALQSLMLFGFLAYFIVCLVRNKRRLKEPWNYEEEVRRQKDERRILIGEKAAKLAGDVFLAGLVAAVFAASLYNMDAFRALYATLAGYVAVRVGCWLYVRRKY